MCVCVCVCLTHHQAAYVHVIHYDGNRIWIWFLGVYVCVCVTIDIIQLLTGACSVWALSAPTSTLCIHFMMLWMLKTLLLVWGGHSGCMYMYMYKRIFAHTHPCMRMWCYHLKYYTHDTSPHASSIYSILNPVNSLLAVDFYSFQYVCVYAVQIHAVNPHVHVYIHILAVLMSSLLSRLFCINSSSLDCLLAIHVIYMYMYCYIVVVGVVRDRIQCKTAVSSDSVC